MAGAFFLLLLPITETGSMQQWEKAQETSLPISNRQGAYSTTEVLVKFSSGYTTAQINRTIRRSGAKILGEIPKIGVYILDVGDGGINETIEYFLQQENVVYVEPNYFAEATDLIPNDPGWGNQYNLAAIRAPAGWAVNSGAIWVTIAILDTGVDLSHPDLFVRILPGYDFVNNDNTPQDDHGHGTHVAAIAAASGNNAVGISGVNWGANILPVKVLNSSANGSYANVANGIRWATDHGAQVINLSLGGTPASFTLNDAVNYAHQNGVILIASTGNAGVPGVLYPAAYEPVIAVGATDSANAWAGFSNYGPEVDLVAPGVNIYSAFPGGAYGYRSGTSMAAPHVSGLAAILWGIPGNGPAKIRDVIEATSLDLGDPGWDPYFGNGLIQMDRAILSAQPPPTSAPTFTALPANNNPAQGSDDGFSFNFQPGFAPQGAFTPTAAQGVSETSGSPEVRLPEPAPEESTANGQDFLTHSLKSGTTESEFYFLPCLGASMIVAGLTILLIVSRRKDTFKMRL